MSTVSSRSDKTHKHAPVSTLTPRHVRAPAGYTLTGSPVHTQLNTCKTERMPVHMQVQTIDEYNESEDVTK